MKELSMEEKAKAYDEALKWMRDLYPNMGIAAKEKAESIFYELAESEDERIRKQLLKHLREVASGKSLELSTTDYERWATWVEKQVSPDMVADAYLRGCNDTEKKLLEKQGEQKPTDEDMKEALRTEYEKGRADAFAQIQKEWSEQDEKMIGRIRGIIEAYAFSQSAVDVNGDLCEKEYIDADNWLKYLKQRIGE